jgi:D-amino peptidase
MNKDKKLKFYISADLEGICGVVSLKQCSPEPDRPAYEFAVRQMMREVTAVCETLYASGRVYEIVVNDAHCSMLNLVYENLPPNVELISGKPKPLAMSAGLSSDFDGVILVGYHAKAGALHGVISHTFHHRLFDVSINGVSLGEAGINALHAQHTYCVPLVLASGDWALGQELEGFIPNLPFVETKRGMGQNAAQCHSWKVVQAHYQEQTRIMLQNLDSKEMKIQVSSLLEGPFEVQVTFLTPLAADNACIIPRLNRIDGRTVSFTADTFAEAYGFLQSSYTILAATAGMD